jgi:hypothetical protein
MPVDLGSNSLLGMQAPSLRKPAYLITLEGGTTGKARNFQRFISLDKPRAENGIVEVKGFFTDKEEDEIVKTFTDILANSPKEFQLEMIFPLQRVHSIRSLVFNAVKNVTPVQPGKA